MEKHQNSSDRRRVAGFCAAVHRTNETVEVKNLIVSPSHQGAGVGRLLMGALEQHFSDTGYGDARLWTCR